jgi:dethiobiotin synthetase
MRGTDTGVGKTFIAAALVRDLYARGINVGVMKRFAAADRVFSHRLSSFSELLCHGLGALYTLMSIGLYARKKSGMYPKDMAPSVSR